MNSDTTQLRRIAEQKLHIPKMLHDYQWEGVGFLYRSRSSLLADEMGLGKSVQTAVAMALLLNGRNEINRALIVAPASLVTNWMTELSTWAPSLTVRRVQGNARSREAFYLLPIPVLVCSYEQIRVDGLDRIPSGTFDLVVLDEVQRIKNRNSSTALACRLLPRKRAWALSATPLENDEDDLVSILSFLDPLVSPKISRTHLTQKLKSLMLRRRKADVRSELPPVLLQDLKLELHKLQKEKYDELWVNRTEVVRKAAADQDATTVLLGLITQLKIICNFEASTNVSSKLDALKIITENAGKDSRILIFSQFVETLQWVSDRLELSHDLVTGSMSFTERQTAIDRFKSGSAPRGLLVSLRAGGVGLNLGEATHVVLFDRWWNPAVEFQAIYRAHRFERDTPLHVVRFLVQDTIENQIAEILNRKEALFDDVIESVETQGHRFTQEELMRILEITPKGFSSGSNS